MRIPVYWWICMTLSMTTPPHTHSGFGSNLGFLKLNSCSPDGLIMESPLSMCKMSCNHFESTSSNRIANMSATTPVRQAQDHRWSSMPPEFRVTWYYWPTNRFPWPNHHLVLLLFTPSSWQSTTTFPQAFPSCGWRWWSCTSSSSKLGALK